MGHYFFWLLHLDCKFKLKREAYSNFIVLVICLFSKIFCSMKMIIPLQKMGTNNSIQSFASISNHTPYYQDYYYYTILLQNSNIEFQNLWKNQNPNVLSISLKRSSLMNGRKRLWGWVVERTFAWMNAFWRSAKDFEITISSQEMMRILSHDMLLFHCLWNSFWFSCKR